MSNSPRTLAVIVHGWMADHRKMAGVTKAVRDAYGENCVTLTPDLPHGKWFSFASGAKVVCLLLEQIDTCVKSIEATGPIERIVLIGHSTGATLVRRAFLVAAGKPDNFEPEAEIADQPKRQWAPKVERIVLLAAFNRGWKISDRMGWAYSIGFNVIGLLGHIAPGDLSPTIFNLRLGAPFMVQTRLNWMAYRRGQRAGGPNVHRPILIQIIGTQDDLIAPIDQVDISVDGTGRALKLGPEGIQKVGGDKDACRDYFLLEMADTGHKNAIVLDGDQAAQGRRLVFHEALIRDRAGLHQIAFDPGLLTDEVDPVDRTVDNVVFVIHGIRDDGFWTHRIAGRIRSAADAQTNLVFRSWTPTYGYFAMLHFMLPWIRQQKVEWFMDQYVGALAQYPAADFHFVGHSNGTYLAAHALEKYRAFRLTNVLFAGSVVRSTFDWIKLIQQNQVQRVQNIVASADCVVAWLPKSVEYWPKFDLGGAGSDGFAQRHPDISELRYVKGGHGAGIIEAHWNQIADFILTGVPLQKQVDAQQKLYAGQPNAFVKRVGQTRSVMALLVIIVLVLAPWSILHIDFSWLPWMESSTWKALTLVAYFWALYFFITRV